MRIGNLIFVLFYFLPGVLDAQDYVNKTALVIGNTNYEVGTLRNPVNDAYALSETLKNLGFDVITRYDLDRIGFRNAIREFGDKVNEQGGVALFYYSGHGLQSEGINYLVPIDADIKDEYEIRDQCIGADMVLRMLNTIQNPFNIIVMDACRDNPYASRYRSRGSDGLAYPEAVPTGSIMAFSTAPGKTASDGDGDFGLYTQELIRAINTQGLDIESVFKQTRIRVKEISSDRQIPWETSSLVGDFYFVKPGQATATSNVSSKLPTLYYGESIIRQEEHRKMINRILTQLSVKIHDLPFHSKSPLFFDIPDKVKKVTLASGESIILSEYDPSGKVIRQEQYNNNFLTSSKNFEYDHNGHLMRIEFTVLSDEEPLPRSIQLHRGDSSVFWPSENDLNFRFRNIFIGSGLVLNIREQDFDFTLNYINLLTDLPKNHILISYSELSERPGGPKDSLIHINTYGASFNKKKLYSYKLSNAEWKLIKSVTYSSDGNLVGEELFDLMGAGDLVIDYDYDPQGKLIGITKRKEGRKVEEKLYSRNPNGIISQLHVQWDFDDQGIALKERKWTFSHKYFKE